MVRTVQLVRLPVIDFQPYRRIAAAYELQVVADIAVDTDMVDTVGMDTVGTLPLAAVVRMQHMDPLAVEQVVLAAVPAVAGKQLVVLIAVVLIVADLKELLKQPQRSEALLLLLHLPLFPSAYRSWLSQKVPGAVA